MQIDEATRQATAPDTERDDRMSSMAVSGAEVGTAADGQTKAEGLRQMDAVVERSNLWRAYERVMRNKGAAGVDGLTVAELQGMAATALAKRQGSIAGGRLHANGDPQSGNTEAEGGVRTLGIPTVLDRLIQQALLQVLQPEFRT